MTVVTWRGAKFAAPVFRGFLEIHFSRYSSLTCKTVSALTGQKQCLLDVHYAGCAIPNSGLHTTNSLDKWEMKNQRMYPPQKPGEPRRPAEVFFVKKNIKHSKRKMWYAASFVKGMMIDEAIVQLRYVNKKAADIVREVLIEAQEEAVAKHNVEYKSNLHIAASFAARAKSEHAVRYHAKGRNSILDLVYCHYFVCLREGPPPEEPKFTGYDQAEDYVKLLRQRNIYGAL